jgi:MerR family transcriptional regulator/heat shock protein HspR
LRVAKVVRLQRDLGVNQEGAAVILELLDRIDALERQLAGLRRR